MNLKNPKMQIAMGVAAVAAVVAVAAGLPPGLLLILAVCPLMMVFMMSAMGGMGQRSQDETAAKADSPSDEKPKHQV